MMIELKITEYALKDDILKSGIRAFHEFLQSSLPQIDKVFAVSSSNYGFFNKLGLHKVEKSYQVDSRLVEKIISDKQLCLYQFKSPTFLNGLSNSYAIVETSKVNNICDLTELIFFGQQLHCEVLNHALNGSLIVYHDMDTLFHIEPVL